MAKKAKEDLLTDEAETMETQMQDQATDTAPATPKPRKKAATQGQEDLTAGVTQEMDLPDLGIPESVDPDAPKGEDEGNDVGMDQGGDTDLAEAEGLHVGDMQAPISGEAIPAPAAKPRRLSDLNLHDLDRYLTAEERAEWNAIYASYRSRSIITGTVIGVDRTTFAVENRETGMTENRNVYSAVIVNHRVKVLIPENEMWSDDAKWAGHVLRSMVGAKLEYVILEIDRENAIAIASRRLALPSRRKYFNTAPRGHKVGERLECQVLASGYARCLITCNGYDRSLTQTEMTYSSIYDLRQQYHPGQDLLCILTEYGNDAFQISVKEATSNPFDGAEFRHPLGSRRDAVITGKYSGGVFVTLSDGLSVLCNYSRLLSDEDFKEGDRVIIAIEHFNFERKLIAGRIMNKLW